MVLEAMSLEDQGRRQAGGAVLSVGEDTGQYRGKEVVGLDSVNEEVLRDVWERKGRVRSDACLRENPYYIFREEKI